MYDMSLLANLNHSVKFSCTTLICYFSWYAYGNKFASLYQTDILGNSFVWSSKQTDTSVFIYQKSTYV